METIHVRTGDGVNLVDVTEQVVELVREKQVEAGLCSLFVPHTTAGITLNSAIDGETPADLVAELNRLVPMRVDFVHQFDSPRDAAGHVKAALVGSSVTVPVFGGQLSLSSSQSILFCEFDGPRDRKIFVTLIGS
jgi:secondary thiamine-phosphate synthase enzyme